MTDILHVSLKVSTSVIFFQFALALASALVLGGCQTASSVSDEYVNTVAEDQYVAGVAKTSIVFVIDGLSIENFRLALSSNRIPEIANFFHLSNRRGFRIGRASFPSLTYPNLTSILTGQTTAAHPITGNRIFLDNKVVNFESVLSWKTLDSLVANQLIFKQLTDRGETSVSFSYPFPGGASAHLEKTIGMGLNYLEKDFAAIDLGVLASLKILLEKSEAVQWPRFIFVHLIGVDSLSHEYGPDSSRVQSHLNKIDSRLAQIFRLLRSKGGGGHYTDAVLTADHGFVKTNYKVPLAEVVEKLQTKIRVLSDNRVTSLYVNPSLSDQDRRDLATGLLLIPHISWSILKKLNSLELYHVSGLRAKIDLAPANCQSGQWAARFRWLHPRPRNIAEREAPYFCPEDFDRVSTLRDETFLVPALTEFFSSPTSPDLIALPDQESDFSGEYRGNHGGLTKSEMLVPLLTRNVNLPEGVIPTSRLIEFLRLLKAPTETENSGR